MEAVNLPKVSQLPTSGGIGELILQNGRQAGTRRPLGMPTTFIGRSPGCDIRLNIDGVDAMHCVLIYSADGLVVRDLNSAHGTSVNGERISSMPIRHGDLLKIGPFQFRVEMSQPSMLELRDRHYHSADGGREAMRVTAASVAAQQIALEEEEVRLLQRQSDLQQQEEQLANHLAEKQRQVQMWSEHTKAERETLRRQRSEQQQLLSQWEQELNEAKEHLGEEQQRLIQERQRINKVYQRLRQRWQRQWSTEKQKYQQIAARLEIESKALAVKEIALREQEAAQTQETLRFNTDRELNTRQLQESWDELKKTQISWKRRQVHERTLAKSRQQELEETLAKMKEARQLLQQEKETWVKQQDALQKELHGLNNRVVHQRQTIKEQEIRLSGLDEELKTRLLHLQRVSDIESTGKEHSIDNPVTAEHAVPDSSTDDAANNVERDRREALEQLICELADQRVHLTEQYKRLAEIQELWSLQREQAASDLEALAEKLHEKEQSLAVREQDSATSEKNLAQDRAEVNALKQEIQAWRLRLRGREQAIEQENQKRMQTLRQQELLLQEQLSALTYLRQRWNRRRQEEIEHIRAEQGQIKQQRQEMHQLREELFSKAQAIEEEKRILAEKTLAVEQYRQGTEERANDPAGQRRIERLRRRWLMQNAVQIRHSSHEREAVKTDLNILGTRLEELAAQMDQLSQANALLAEQQSALEEREALLQAKEKEMEQAIMQNEAQRQLAEEKYLRMKDEVERMARIVYEEPDTSSNWSNDKAA